MIVTIEDKDVKACQDVALKYFSLKVGEKEIKEIIMSCPTVISELITESIGDTYARDYLIMAVCGYVFKGHKSFAWPCNGDSDEYSKDFFTTFLNNIKEKNLDIHLVSD